MSDILITFVRGAYRRPLVRKAKDYAEAVEIAEEVTPMLNTTHGPWQVEFSGEDGKVIHYSEVKP